MKKKFYSSLSKKYRSSGKGDLSKGEVEAYLAARMPATQAAIGWVLSEIVQRISCPIERLLDLGAGMGAGTLAARELLELKKMTLIEKNLAMIAKGKELIEGEWVAKDLGAYLPEKADLALFGYSYGELSQAERLLLLERVFAKCQMVVIVEPGTPKGYANVLEARKKLIELGGKMIAPCPHVKPCPMEGKDWCHFSVRLERSREHQLAKGGKVGYEDEKFSYIAMGKSEANVAEARIVRHPLKRGGHVALQLCTENKGLIEKTISKKEGELYKWARKAVWGQGTSPQGPKPH